MLKQRILTALWLLPLMVIMLFWSPSALWAIFGGVISLLALWELSRIGKLEGPIQWAYLTISAVLFICLYALDWQLAPLAQWLVLGFWLILAPLWLKLKAVLRGALGTMLLGWMLLVPFWLAFVQLRPNTDMAWYLLSLMALVWIADVGAYAFGRLFGKNKLAPAISPGKSWEGAIGGLACVLIYSTILYACDAALWPSLGWIANMILSIMLTVVSIEGDLLESWLKRTAGVKDSSQLLPGHGGVFDRIDSLIAVLSVFAALVTLAS